MGALADLGGWPAVLGHLVAHQDLTADTARAAMDEILAGEASPAQLGAFVVALRMKGEAVDELNGMLDAMLAAELERVGGDVVAGDCHLANTAITELTGRIPQHPLQIVARAYGIPVEHPR